MSARSKSAWLRGVCTLALAAVLVLGLAACASAQPTISDEDRLALQQLTAVAQRDAGVLNGADAGAVECWVPTESSLDNDTTFRVICRVHFIEADAQRYRDMICIGNLGSDPVTDYCYQWAYYSDMPSFEHQRAVTVS